MDLINKLDKGESYNWKKFMDRDTIKLYYKQEGVGSLYTFYMEKIVNAPLFNLISVLAEA